MEQTKLVEIQPMAKTWDCIRHIPFDDARQRAIQGLPHYWKIPWGYVDEIILPCGHKTLAYVSVLDDPNASPRCPQADYGNCNWEPEL